MASRSAACGCVGPGGGAATSARAPGRAGPDSSKLVNATLQLKHLAHATVSLQRSEICYPFATILLFFNHFLNSRFSSPFETSLTSFSVSFMFFDICRSCSAAVDHLDRDRALRNIMNVNATFESCGGSAQIVADVFKVFANPELPS